MALPTNLTFLVEWVAKSNSRDWVLGSKCRVLGQGGVRARRLQADGSRRGAGSSRIHLRSASVRFSVAEPPVRNAGPVPHARSSELLRSRNQHEAFQRTELRSTRHVSRSVHCSGQQSRVASTGVDCCGRTCPWSVSRFPSPRPRRSAALQGIRDGSEGIASQCRQCGSTALHSLPRAPAGAGATFGVQLATKRRSPRRTDQKRQGKGQLRRQRASRSSIVPPGAS
jgi:hypothetical protein